MLNVNMQKKLSHFMLDVQFHVNNEIVVLFGSSGSGKTMILNGIAGLTTLDAGSISLGDALWVKDGKSIVPVQKREVGYLFQDYALFPHMTVWENIMYGAKNSSFASKIVEELQIAKLKQAYPHEISGGEKQRTAIARALATEPKLLLLDEPFSALDHDRKARAHDELLRLFRMWEIPVILVTHDYDEAKKLGNRILHIHQGRLKK